MPRFLEIYEANAAQLTRPYPGVPETLTALRDRGYRAAICTNKPQRATIAVLQGVGLLPFFDGIAGGDRFAVRKPDPGHLLGVISELGASPAASAMIGDNENDAAAARAAAVPLVLMRYGYARVDPDTCQRTPCSTASRNCRTLSNASASLLDMPPGRPAKCGRLDGRVAQRESTPFTRVGSQVQSLSRPPAFPPDLPRI